MSGMAKQRPQVNVALDPEQRERWGEVVEKDPRFDTLSALVRLAVEKEIKDDSSRESQAGGKELAKVSERLEALENQISGLSSDMSELKGVVRSQQPNNSNLRSEVFAALPEGTQGVYNAVTPEEVASKIGGPVDAETVSNVLEDLAEETGQVLSHVGPEEGEIRYNKKGDN